MKVWIKRWGPAILMMSAIFVASSTPGNDLPNFGFLDMIVKKGGHMLGYALLAAAYLHGLINGKPLNRRILVLAVVLAALYAATDEFHQRFTSGRTPASRDVLIDTVGAVLGAWLWPRVRVFLQGYDQSARA